MMTVEANTGRAKAARLVDGTSCKPEALTPCKRRRFEHLREAWRRLFDPQSAGVHALRPGAPVHGAPWSSQLPGVGTGVHLVVHAILWHFSRQYPPRALHGCCRYTMQPPECRRVVRPT